MPLMSSTEQGIPDTKRKLDEAEQQPVEGSGLKRRRGDVFGHDASDNDKEVCFAESKEGSSLLQASADCSIEHEESGELGNVNDNYEQADDSDSMEDDFDECEEWPWLKAVSVRESMDGGHPIGHCNGFLIDRGHIQRSFYSEMDKPSHDIKELSLALFDRWAI